MTNEEIKLKELELRVKELEDKVFNTWLSQYQPINYWPSTYDAGYVGPVSKFNPEFNKETK